MERNKFTYPAEVVRVVDGDTIDVIIDIGFNTFTKKRLRFSRIDAYESRTRDLEEKKLGLAAKAFVKAEIKAANNKVTIQTVKKGKYGRWIAEIWVDGTILNLNLNDALVSAELAVYRKY